MRELGVDISRLTYLAHDEEGLESFLFVSKFKDFIQYYTKRFVSNVKHAFKDFTHPEIVAYNERYKRQLELVLADPLLSLTGLLVPTPKGMVSSYRETLDVFMGILDRSHALDLLNDLEQVTHALTTKSFSHTSSTYTRSDFEKDKALVGKLYTKNGLVHSLGEKALKSLGDVSGVNSNLLHLTKTHYLQAIDLSKQVEYLDKGYKGDELSSSEKTKATQVLMSLAYRISIFAVVLDHIQEMEHAFVSVLDVLKRESHRK